MNRTRLHVIEGKTLTSRLCDTCGSGVVMRSAKASEDEVFCLFIAHCVSPDIVSCNRYSERNAGPGAATQLCETAWVA